MDIGVILQHDISTANAYAILTIDIGKLPKTFDEVIKAAEAKLREVVGISLHYQKDFLINHPENVQSLLIPNCNCHSGIGVSRSSLV